MEYINYYLVEQINIKNAIVSYLGKKGHKIDVINEIDYLNEDRENKIRIDDVLIDELTEDYEARLEDNDSWNFYLKQTFEKFEIGE